MASRKLPPTSDEEIDPMAEYAEKALMEIETPEEQFERAEEAQKQYDAHLASLSKLDEGGLGFDELNTLIDEHRKALEEGKGNSSESTQRLRRILADSIAFDMPARKLQEMWEAIDKMRYAPESIGLDSTDEEAGEYYLNCEGPTRNNAKDSSALEQFEYFVAIRRYPPPETLLAIGEIFARYLNAKGGLSLDEAFFGEPHKKKQSLAFKRSRDQEMDKFGHELFCSQMVNKSETREQIAKSFKGDELRISPENYTRKYDMWKAKKRAEREKKEAEKKS